MTTTPTRYTERIVVDTCSLLNWVNGGAFDAIVSLPLTMYVVGSLVEAESTTIAQLLAQHVASGTLVRLRNEDLDAAVFLDLIDTYGLGEGETECLAHALASDDLIVCSDDRKARAVVAALLGPQRLTGTIGLLLRCFRNGIISADELRRAHQMMTDAGAFLPPLSAGDLGTTTTGATSHPSLPG
jgi:predicted nucleic acid-binding protein